MALDSKTPEGPLEDKWDNHRFDIKLVNPANKRRFDIIVALFIVFHLFDLTWGQANAEWVRGDPYNNLVYSLQRPAVALVYILGNIALVIHLYHGAWSIFQSMGVNNPRINKLRRTFATAFAGVILVGNLSFPILIQLNVVGLQCPHTQPTTAPCKA